MLPTPRAGWVLSLEFTDFSQGRYLSPASKWEGIESFAWETATAPDDLDVGDRHHVQTMGTIRDGMAIVQGYSAGRNDQLTPSGTQVVRVEDSTDEFVEATLDSYPFVDTVRLYGDAPVETLSVPIDAVAPMDGFALSDISHYTWPNGGDTIRVFTNQGQEVVRSLQHGYEFHIDSPAPISGPAKATVRYEDGVMLGTIEEFETEQPNEGEVVSATLDYTKTKGAAWVGPYDDRIQVDKTLPVVGEAEIQISNETHPLEGELVAGPDNIPDIGDTISAYVRNPDQDATYAHAKEFEGRLSLPNGADQSGLVDVEILEVDSEIIGEIKSYRGGPEVGDIVEVDVERGQSPVTGTIIASGASVRISENVLVSGTIEVRITDDSPPFTGEVASYQGLLPDVGDRIPATISQSISFATAEPNHGSFLVILLDCDDYEGHGVVEITEIGDRILGDLVEQQPVSQSSSSSSDDNPFIADSNMWNITQKKY